MYATLNPAYRTCHLRRRPRECVRRHCMITTLSPVSRPPCFVDLVSFVRRTKIILHTIFSTSANDLFIDGEVLCGSHNQSNPCQFRHFTYPHLLSLSSFKPVLTVFPQSLVGQSPFPANIHQTRGLRHERHFDLFLSGLSKSRISEEAPISDRHLQNSQDSKRSPSSESQIPLLCQGCFASTTPT